MGGVRADRLVAILLLLQARGRVTAGEVAAELEISERTARRDLEALGQAGLPIYSRQGRGGGWELLGGARTDLSGLSAPEVRALFLVAGPSSATPEVRAALRKLVRALPEPFRPQAEAASTAVVVDPSGWGSAPPRPERPTPTHLDRLQRAVVEGEQVRLGYEDRERTPTTRVVHPLGLAAKRSVWYLVADTDAGLRTFRVERVRSVEGLGEPVVRPAGFDLAEAWRLVTERVGERFRTATATARARPDGVGVLRHVFGPRVRVGPPEPDGTVTVEVSGSDERILAAELAGFGALLEVVDPPVVREHLARLGAELVAHYGVPAATAPPTPSATP
jgi:predicted DNA-binding transcriptional regulator YafY